MRIPGSIEEAPSPIPRRGGPSTEPSWKKDGDGSRRKRRLRSLVFCAGLGLSGVCGGWNGRTDAAETASRRPELRPVILVPGISGSMLRDRETGEIAWGTGGLLVRPKDDGYAVALPIAASPDAEPRLEAFAVIEEMTLAGVIRKKIYGPILERLEALGHRRGDFENPDAASTLFPFPYDWRLSNVTSARRLAHRLEKLRRARGEEILHVDLVCQSNGAHVCRYFLKYGGASLAEAEAGTAAPLAEIAVRKLILMGSSNGGGIRNLREIDRGRSYVALIGRKWQPETLFTFPSIYQDLPVYRRSLFLDEQGRELAVDLFDAEAWRRHGWSIFSRGARRRLAKNPRPDLFADETYRIEYLRRILDDSRRFHRLLGRDVAGFGATRYYLLQSRTAETPDRAVLFEKGDGWRTLFTGDRELARHSRLHARATAAGDGHATVDSQMWLSPQERGAVVGEPTYVDSDHLDLVFADSTLGHLAVFLSRDEGPDRDADAAAPVVASPEE